MKQKISNLLLIVLVAATAFCMKADATEQKSETRIHHIIQNEAALEESVDLYDWGYCEDGNVMWGVTTDGILIFDTEGTTRGTLTEYTYGNGPWSIYKNDIWFVMIGGTIDAVGESMFHKYPELMYVYVEEGVQSIGRYAFAYCPKLEEVVLADTITNMGSCVFFDCKSLASINIPRNLKAIPVEFIRFCEGVKSLTIPNGVTEIGAYALAQTGIENLVIPNSVKKIGRNAFATSGLKSVTLPNGLTAIEEQTFSQCWSLMQVNIPETVTKIGSAAFDRCYSLQSISIPSSVNTIEDRAFEKCGSLKKVPVMNPNVNYGTQVFPATNAGLVLSCTKNSTTHKYALNNNLKFVLTDSDRVYECFADIKEYVWYKDAVQYVFDKNLMSGSGDFFYPTNNMTRAQLVTTLYRLAGSPEVTDYTACEIFPDVAFGKYYTDAVCWAYNMGITTGSDGKFNTADNLSRQQLAAFFFRFAEVMGYDTTERADFSDMLNADNVSDYAVEAVEWAVGAGLISGSATKDEAGNVVYDLKPQGNTTRAQLAAILQRFCEKYEVYE